MSTNTRMNDDFRIKRKDKEFNVMREELNCLNRLRKTTEYKKQFKLDYIERNFGKGWSTFYGIGYHE